MLSKKNKTKNSHKSIYYSLVTLAKLNGKGCEMRFSDEDIYACLEEFKKEQAQEEVEVCLFVDISGNVL